MKYTGLMMMLEDWKGYLFDKSNRYEEAIKNNNIMNEGCELCVCICYTFTLKRINGYG